MADVLLTGASGFVGQHLLRELEEQGHRLLLPLRPGWSAKLPFKAANHKVVEVNDLFSKSGDWWENQLDGIDTVIHAAWYAEPGAFLTSEQNFDCLKGTLTIARAAAEKGVRRFVGLGTCAEYKTSDSPLDVDDRLEATSPYAAAKIGAFLMLREWFCRHSVSFLWCRLFHLYGAGEDPRRLVPHIREKLQKGERVDLTEGKQIRDFIEISEAAKMIISGCFSDYEGAVNICTGRGRSVRDLVMEIAGSHERQALLNFGARPENEFDPPFLVGVPSYEY
jgi:nucleoside-diphosphate-sugar epimerase